MGPQVRFCGSWGRITSPSYPTVSGGERSLRGGTSFSAARLRRRAQLFLRAARVGDGAGTASFWPDSDSGAFSS